MPLSKLPWRSLVREGGATVEQLPDLLNVTPTPSVGRRAGGRRRSPVRRVHPRFAQSHDFGRMQSQRSVETHHLPGFHGDGALP